MNLPKIDKQELLIRESVSKLKLRLMEVINEHGNSEPLGSAFIVINLALGVVSLKILEQEKLEIINNLKIGAKKW